MEDKKQKLLEMLASSMLVSEESKTKIRSKFDTLNEDQLGKLIALFEDSLNLQERLIKKVLEKNPHFLTELKKHVADEAINEIHEKEAESRKEDDKVIAELEAEIDKIVE